MAKFSGTTRRPARTNPVASSKTTRQRVRTHEAGLGYAPDLETELFLLAATNMVGEDTFYEDASQRDARFVDLIHRVTAANPAFIAGADPDGEQVGLAQYVRQSLRLRSAAVVMAAEYVAAGGANGRSVVARALQRPDEPAELVGYWFSTYGRALPMPVKRGVADAVRRLYNERAVLRYDGQSRDIRMADVIELTHPVPRDAKQSALFKFILDRRHHGDAVAPGQLPLLAAMADLDAVPVDDRRALLRARGPEALAAAGMTWERLSSWLPGGMDAEAWEAVIPSMGAMALIRNLRNFDQADLSEASVDTVVSRITDPGEVAKARLFPHQVWAAYKHAPSDDWKRALGRTLALTVEAIPALHRSLILIDTSGSMQAPLSGRSAIQRVEVAAVMAMATAKRAIKVDVVVYGQDSALVPGLHGASVLGAVDGIVRSVGAVGHATYGHTAIARWFDPARHTRVIVFTDDQQQDAGHVRLDHVPLIYTFDLAGYRPRAMESGARGRYTLGGFTDATFEVMRVLEDGRNASWPF